MNLAIEDNFIELQKKTTHALIDQRVILSEQEQIDTFLDKINHAKITHSKLIPEYNEVIELTVSFLQNTQPIEQLISVSESINNLVGTTKRLIKSFGEAKLKDCFINEVKEYKLLLSDINEILDDIQNRIADDKEMADILNDL
jgi:uncharacterized coiled-coil DUF342 family protein